MVLGGNPDIKTVRNCPQIQYAKNDLFYVRCYWRYGLLHLRVPALISQERKPFTNGIPGYKMDERTAIPCVHCGDMSLIIGGKSVFFRNVWGINHDGMSVVIGGKLHKIYDIMCAAERTVGAEVGLFAS